MKRERKKKERKDYIIREREKKKSLSRMCKELLQLKEDNPEKLKKNKCICII